MSGIRECELERGADRARARAVSPGRPVGLVSLLVSLLLAPLPNAAAEPTAPPTSDILRLGSTSDWAVRGRVVRPILETEAGRGGVALSNLPASRLWIAAARDEEAPSPAEPIVCRVDLVRTGKPTLLLAKLELAGDRVGWQEAESAIDAIVAGELALSCLGEGAASVAWARPLALPQRAPAMAPAIVLMSLDTLRADKVAGFGGPSAMTPNLGRLGDEGLRVLEANSDGTWTVPSHKTLLISRYWERDAMKGTEQRAVRLAQEMADQGYLTIGVTGGGFVSNNFGFNRGFDSYSMPPDTQHLVHLDSMLEAATGWLERSRDVPIFLFFHTYAVHLLSPDHLEWLDKHPRSVPFAPTGLPLARSLAWYDELVRSTDAGLGPFFETLRAVAKQRPVVLVVVSDHGEAFMEHGFYGHGTVVPHYDEVVHIPMIVWAPGRVPAGAVDSAPTMLVDVGPSLMTAAGLEPPAEMLGRDLWPSWTAGRRDDVRGSVSRNERYWSLRTPHRKLIVGHPKTRRGGGQSLTLELYDLAQDPSERRNLAADQPAVVSALLSRLEQRLRELGVPEEELARLTSATPVELRKTAPMEERMPEALDDTTREQLKALGYIE